MGEWIGPELQELSIIYIQGGPRIVGAGELRRTGPTLSGWGLIRSRSDRLKLDLTGNPTVFRPRVGVCRPALNRAENRVMGQRSRRRFLRHFATFCDMSEDERKNAKTLFAVAVARGASASSWARSINISLRTAMASGGTQPHEDDSIDREKGVGRRRSQDPGGHL